MPRSGAKETCVMGIDPGLACTGYGIIMVSGNELRFTDCGVVRTSAEMPMPLRLMEIADGIHGVVNKHSPRHVVVERVYVNMNPISSLKLGEARGAAVIAAQLKGAGVSELTPKEVKRTITGSGSASKKHVASVVNSILGLDNSHKIQSDAYDALACAICFHLVGISTGMLAR